MNETQGRTLTNAEIRDRYEAGTMGYDSCILYLKRYGLTEAQADEVLHPPKKK